MIKFPLDTAFKHIQQVLRTAEATDGQLLESFIHTGDESIFAALVKRHGKLVLGVSRRVDLSAEDSEDVFQATFFMLARKARSLTHQSTVAGWLYTVAYRLALKVRHANGSRRRLLEKVKSKLSSESVMPPITADEQLPQLDKELARLPERYRDPVLLCLIEGKSYEDAARELGMTRDSLRGRLAKGRELLRKRLSKSAGVAITAAALNLLLGGMASAAAPSADLILRTARCATLAAGRQGVSAVLLSEGARYLVDSLTATMPLAKLYRIVGLIGLFGVITTVAWIPLRHFANRPSSWGTTVVAAADGPAAPEPSDPKERLRDLYGDPLPPAATARFGTVRWDHWSDQNGVVAFAPDGKTIATNAHGDVVLLEAATGAEVRMFRHTDEGDIGSIAFSLDGKTLATARTDGAARLWDVATGKLRFECRPEATAGVFAVALSPDTKILVSGGSSVDSSIRMWDTATGKSIRNCKGHTSYTTCVAFAPSGNNFATTSSDKTVRMWDSSTGKEVQRPIDYSVESRSLAFSPNSKTLALAGADGIVRLWDVEKWALARAFPRQEHAVLSVQFSPDGKTLASAGGDRMIRLWDVASGEELRRWQGNDGVVTAVSFSPDGKELVSVGGDRNIRVFETATGKSLRNRPGHSGPVLTTFLSAEGKCLLSVGTDGTLRNSDTVTGQELKRFTFFEKQVEYAAFSPDGKFLAHADRDGWIRLNDVVTGKETPRWRVPCNNICAFDLAPDGTSLVTHGDSNTLQLWDIRSNKLLRTLAKHECTINSVKFSPDGKVLATTAEDRVVRLWSVSGGTLLHTLPEPLGLGAVAFSPDGRVLAVSRMAVEELEDVVVPEDTPVRLWEVASGKEIRTFRGHFALFHRLAFSSDGKFIAGAYRNTIRIWNTASGRELPCFRGHRGLVTHLTFAKDGKTLASASEDSTVLLWKLPPAPEKVANELSAEDALACWEDLASADAAKAYQAIDRLETAPRQAVPLLAERFASLVPHPMDDRRLVQLLNNLDHDSFDVRKQAAQELEQCGTWIVPALRRSLKNELSLETRRRIEALIEKAGNANEVAHPGSLRALRAIQVLEHIDSQQSRTLLKELSQKMPEAPWAEEAEASLKRLGH